MLGAENEGHYRTFYTAIQHICGIKFTPNNRMRLNLVLRDLESPQTRQIPASNARLISVCNSGPVETR